MDSPSSGRLANRSGGRLEESIAQILEERGYRQVSALRFIPMRQLEQPIFAHQFTTGQDIYAKRRRVDFILYHPTAYPKCLVIQCKWQSSRGSVEEKYPYEVLNIATNVYPTIVILDGGGYSKGAKEWLTKQAGKSNLQAVYDLGGFHRFASGGGLGSSSR